MSKSLRIAVVGSGAIGIYYGAKLAQGGCDVHFLMRGNLDRTRADGLYVKGEGENFRVNNVQCYGSTSEIGPCDLVLVAVKVTSNGALTEMIPPLLCEKTILLTFQNGLGNEEFLAAHFGSHRVLGGVCFICLTRTSPNEVERADPGYVSLGAFDRRLMERAEEVAAEFKACRIACKAVENVVLERWRKLVWNVPFNGLTILGGKVDTAFVLSHRPLRYCAVELMKEVIAASTACGFPLPENEIAEQFRRTENMGAYRPSTLLDFESGRPFEFENIWGESLRRGRAAGLAMPYLEVVFAALSQLAAANGDQALSHRIIGQARHSLAVRSSQPL